ncbi:NAD(P)/FAD-dependent oxidoreductase [uncultured Ruthenibacterium sp.]|uniref:NAD(P)/FAD-dependent oxidoreductase n=1 Tax=uncultured Ruthenibacterium sp. TaxID=1905347 RepID=UPI00349E65E3
MEKVWDCIVVGGGPAGLSAAINLRQRGKQPLVLSAGENLLRKAEQVDNYLGLPGLTGSEMMDQFLRHAHHLSVEIRTAQAGNIMPLGDTFLVNAGGEILTCRSVILACGVSKAKTVPGEEEFLGRGVSYCATCDGMLYRGQEIAVWGLGPDAPDEAAFLASIGCHVHYIAQKKPESLADGIEFLQGRVDAVEGAQTVEHVNVGDQKLPVAGVFILRASVPAGALVPGLSLTEEGFVSADSKKQTSIPGLFVAGDMCGKPLQVAKAVGDGLVAALSCAEYLDGTAQ